MEEHSLSWIEKLKVSIKSWINELDLTTFKVLEILSYFAIGFFFGFFIFRYAKYVLFSILILSISIFFLDYFGFILINWVKVREFTGINPNESVSAILKHFIEWLKNNLPQVISFFIGFLIGLKIGQK